MQYEFEREPGFVRLHKTPGVQLSLASLRWVGREARPQPKVWEQTSIITASSIVVGLILPGQVTQRQRGRLNRRVAEEVFRTSRKRWRKNGNPQRLSLDNEGDLFATLSLLRHEGWVDVDVTWATAANFIDWVKAAATSTMLCCVFCVMKYSISLWKDSW